MMADQLDSHGEIARLSEELLRRADAVDQWPTPVADIVEASKLEESDESPLAIATLKRAPQHLRRAVKLINSRRIRAILDRRERTVHLDPSIEHEGRRSFLKLHEVGHDLLPWQAELGYADDDLTLSWAANLRFEREANQCAAELFFQGARFQAMAAEYAIGFGAVSALAEEVGASVRATLRRYAETHRSAVCGIVLEKSPRKTDPLTYRRYEVSGSPAWEERFGHVWPKLLDATAFPFLAAIHEPSVGQDPELSWPDIASQPVKIKVETHQSRFGILLLLWVPRREILKRRRVLARETM
jgi:hypothetical protein